MARVLAGDVAANPWRDNPGPRSPATLWAAVALPAAGPVLPGKEQARLEPDLLFNSQLLP